MRGLYLTNNPAHSCITRPTVFLHLSHILHNLKNYDTIV